MSVPSATVAPARPAGLIAALLVPIVLGSLACAAIAAAVGTIATIPSEFMPFTPGAYISAATIGVIAGMIGWEVVRRRAANPAAVLRILVPVVVPVSLVPDVMLGVSESSPGTTWPGVIGLMVMHLAVAAIAVASFVKFLPLAHRDRPGS
ncbi:hypothetical protein JQS43_22245 [Natronosporangium hydrolyticum]|uniref:Uncharacterized protein n=1 Tax=Natronosporangium hydrolyticum TaxID=2811111 RepID=A0A895YI15_9ACTN|nr:hypothetical protein [Natronosporangium hydrolyticum]QSB14206.1 hypothetical protein JQS43_22245 [Natronosporangium hydrolyticum]